MVQFRKPALLWTGFIFIFFSVVHAQENKKKSVVSQGIIQRPDGNGIPFTIISSGTNDKTSLVIQNADERIALKNIQRKGDSLFAEFPVFESRIHLFTGYADRWTGFWFKGSPAGYSLQPLQIYLNRHDRFKTTIVPPKYNISGRWSVEFIRNDHSKRPSVAEFVQTGNDIKGTFLNLSGDYRYLEGIVSGDSLMLSTFDGSHAFYFRAQIESGDRIVNGLYCSGTARKENWSALKDANAKLPDDSVHPSVAKKDEPLKFSFPDLDGKMISIQDQRFRNKVVVIQLMGSWCSNCMDETAFLSEFYHRNKSRGVELMGLGYEYSTDRDRSAKSMRKFRERFHVEYPLLITGATASDSLRIQKTLPQLENIESFPTTIFVDKSGRVRKIHTGFSGPATGEHYEEEKKMFQDEVDELLSE